MQGRLLPKYNGRYQAHPIGYWKKEFPIASKLGLDSIEFILDFNQAEKNPLLTEEGIKEIFNYYKNKKINYNNNIYYNLQIVKSK